ncbi:MAG: CHC2 zinc finger domain-containing protein [Candidatus Omnitrophica bacterium]|nr:CHC2 zinc finger domain-containing protein [Candidatus Omnitrophota bacterium]
MCFPKWRIKQAEDKLDIVDLIQYFDVPFSTVQYGVNYNAKCPFHDDSGYSLRVNREKKLYYCPVCGAGGNMMRFLQKREAHLKWPEIVKLAFVIAEEIEELNSKTTNSIIKNMQEK